MIISYYNGFFDGVPAFLGYAFGVFFTFRIRIKALHEKHRRQTALGMFSAVPSLPLFHVPQ